MIRRKNQWGEWMRPLKNFKMISGFTNVRSRVSQKQQNLPISYCLIQLSSYKVRKMDKIFIEVDNRRNLLISIKSPGAHYIYRYAPSMNIASPLCGHLSLIEAWVQEYCESFMNTEKCMRFYWVAASHSVYIISISKEQVGHIIHEFCK